VRNFRKNRSGVAVTIITLFCFIFVIGMLWFFFSTIVEAVAAPSTILANSFHNESWPFYNILSLAESFMSNLWLYLLVISMVGFALWVYYDSQLKGERM